MNIAIVMKDYDELKGGAERYFANLTHQLAEAKYSVDLIVNKISGNIPAGIVIQKINAVRWSSILEPLSFNWSSRKYLSDKKYDIIYALTQIYPSDVYRVGGGLEHSLFDIRYRSFLIRIIQYIRPRNFVRFFIEDRIFDAGNYRKIITNSYLCKNQILGRYRVSPQDIAVIYNNVNKAKFNAEARSKYRDKIRKDLSIPGNDKVLLFISNNWKRKGLAELIKAYALFRDGKIDEGKNTWLLVAGKGRKGRYVSLGKMLGVADKIIFLDPTDKPEMLCGAGDVFVLPTYYDPCANVCIEALTCGLPVITTKMNGASELINDGENGFVVSEPYDTKDLAENIAKALKIRNVINTRAANENNVEDTIAVFKNLKSKTLNEILVSDGCDQVLLNAEWNSFASVMNERRGVLYKKNNLRSVVRIDLADKKYFLKRHFKRSNPSWAFREWHNIFTLKSLGIRTMDPVAVGEKGDLSFIITEAVEPSERLEDLIKTGLPPERKRKLVKMLAEMTKTLHNNGLFHKDYYTGHIFVKRVNNKDELYLIDLQRMRRHYLFKKHWIIKDLAALVFSTYNSCLTNLDRIRFLKYYLGSDYNKKRRHFLFTISAKAERISSHTEKLLEKRKKINL